MIGYQLYNPLLQIINSMKAHLAKGSAYKAIKEIDDMINEAIL